MKAIILAAGTSSRLYPITLSCPKCMLEVAGKRIIDRQLDCIKRIGIDNIIIVTGHKRDTIERGLGNNFKYRFYKDYKTKNNLHTLWSVRDELRDDFLCLFSDVIFDIGVIKQAKDSVDDICMIVDTSRVLEGTMRIKIENGQLTSVGNHITISEASGNFIGIAKFSKLGAKYLLNEMQGIVSAQKDDYYTIAINNLAKKGVKVAHIDIKDNIWAEIDTKEDLYKANQLYITS